MPRDLDVRPATPGRWGDLEALFGPRGAVGGCWCMDRRLSRSDYEEGKGEGNRRRLKALVESGRPPGLLAYRDGRPVGWCAVGPREDFAVLDRSRVLKRVDDRPVWSVACFFIAKEERGKGVSGALLETAIDHARAAGAETVEGYPIDPSGGEVPPVFAFPGLLGTFLSAGFVEVARRSPTRPVVRRPV